MLGALDLENLTSYLGGNNQIKKKNQTTMDKLWLAISVCIVPCTKGT